MLDDCIGHGIELAGNSSVNLLTFCGTLVKVWGLQIHVTFPLSLWFVFGLHYGTTRALSQVKDGRKDIKIYVMVVITIRVRGGLDASIFLIYSGSGPRKDVAQFPRWAITKFVILFQFWILLKEEKNDAKIISSNTTYLSSKGHKNK